MRFLRVITTLAVITIGGTTAGSAPQTARPWPPQGLLPINEAAPVLSPADELATFILPPGYRVELVASEPLVQDAVAFDWDLDGRLWVVEMPGYMRDIAAVDELEPVGRVVVLDDTNNDGRMDTRTVFLDTLVLARTIKVLDHGVLIGEPPDLWLARDTNGDFKADTKERVTNLFGRRNANVEHNANSLMWALDNWMYTSEVDMDLRWTPAGFEVRRTLSRGQWGVTQDDAGRIFRNTNESVLHVDYVPARYFMRHPTLLRTRGSYESLAGDNRETNRVWPVRPTRGVNRGYQAGVLKADGSLANFTSVSAPTIYRGGTLPAELNGNVFVVEPAGNLVARIVLQDDGSTLRARKAYEGGEFLVSTDERFRPVNLTTAPDGTLYILDMYRGIIQHKGYITEYLRDHILGHALEQPIGHGRIWRVMHETTRRGPRPSLSRSTPAELVALLSHQNGWWRDTAQRLLVERQATSVAPQLTRLVTQAPDWRTRLHALWTLDGLGVIAPATVTRALGDPSRDVRVAAVRLSERWVTTPGHAMQASLLARLEDADWAVRRQLAATLGELPEAAKIPALATMIERHGADPIVLDAAASGLRGQEHTMLARLLTGPAGESPARSMAVTLFAATVVRGAENGRVQQIFTWAADPTRAAWQRAALIRGAEVALLNAAMPVPARVAASAPAAPPAAAAPAPCPTCPGGRAGPGGAPAFPSTPAAPGTVATRPRGPALRLGSEPAIVGLPATDPLAIRVAALLATIEWPGKPGASAPLTPLTTAETARFDAGREVYANICAACHQTDGRGRVGLAPTLVGSELALGPAGVPARILLHGKEGSTGLMPPLGSTLSDDQVAAVLTYIRREWGQDGSAVDAAAVKQARDAGAGRTRPWTNEELRPLLSEGTAR